MVICPPAGMKQTLSQVPKSEAPGAPRLFTLGAPRLFTLGAPRLFTLGAPRLFTPFLQDSGTILLFCFPHAEARG
jgi:hypothetical protein